MIKKLFYIIPVVILCWFFHGCYKSDREKELKRIYPFIHVECKQHHDNKDYPLVCEECQQSYIKDADIRLPKLFKQWERAKGKPWGEGGLTDYDVNEFCKILENHKILLYRK